MTSGALGVYTRDGGTPVIVSTFRDGETPGRVPGMSEGRSQMGFGLPLPKHPFFYEENDTIPLSRMLWKYELWPGRSCPIMTWSST